MSRFNPLTTTSAVTAGMFLLAAFTMVQPATANVDFDQAGDHFVKKCLKAEGHPDDERKKDQAEDQFERHIEQGVARCND